MKKLLLALPVVAGVSWAGTSYYAGVEAESAYDQLLTQGFVLEPLVFEKESFENGISTSRAVTTVRESSADDAEVLFRLEHIISHSPVRMGDDGAEIGSASIRTTFLEEAGNSELAEIKEWFGGKEPVEVITKVDTSGDIDSQITIESFGLEHEGESFNFAKSTVDVLTRQDKSTVASGTIGEAVFNLEKDSTLTMKPSSFDMDIKELAEHVYSYDMSWNSPEMIVNSDDFPNAVKLSDFGIGMKSGLVNGNIDSSGYYEIGDIDLGDMIPAEQAPIKNARIDMEFNGFDFEAVKVFAAFMNKLSMKEQYELGESFDEEAMGMFADLLTTDLNAKIALNLGNGGGKANSDFAIRFIGDGSKSGYADIVTVADILNAIEVDLNMKADKGALALTPAMMFTDSPEAQMVLADGGDHFYTKATLRGTAVELNDNFFPLQDMVGEMLDMPIEALLAMGGL